MEYERIHKPQTGLISPTKLRMLMGPHHQKKKKDGSNSNSSSTSPSKFEESQILNNGLLAGDFDHQVPKLSQGRDESSSSHPNELMPRENGEADYVRAYRLSKGENSNFNAISSVRAYEEENLDYDSTSSFEFHKGERLHHHPTRSLSRPMPSKWDDAEKWILNRQTVPPSFSKKMYLQNLNQQHQHRTLADNAGRVAPECTSYENKLLVKRVDFVQPTSQLGSDKFDTGPNGSNPASTSGNAPNASIELLHPEFKDLMEVERVSLPSTDNTAENATGIPHIRAVSMRDMGTEMTPIPSQEPSRTASPLGSTPLRSPTSSAPSTPRWGEPAPTPTGTMLHVDVTQSSTGNGKMDMLEQDLKLKTRREIVALGVRLGKMNIAAWASKDDKSSSVAENNNLNEFEQIEFAKRAASWEEIEKTKHNSRYKREEIKIQAWETQQKAKLEAELRRVEAQAEQMKAQAQADMVKKIALARQMSEEKRAAAEARRNKKAQEVAAQSEYIRHSGRLPASFMCCGWS